MLSEAQTPLKSSNIHMSKKQSKKLSSDKTRGVQSLNYNSRFALSEKKFIPVLAQKRDENNNSTKKGPNGSILVEK